MSKLSLGVLAATLAMISAAHATCSDRTIRGDYAFTLHGNSLSADGITSTGRQDGVGIITFDGGGNFTQQGFVVRNGTQIPGIASSAIGFSIDQTGTYSVNGDCTGIANLVLGPGNERALALVISKSAGTIHAIVSGATIGGNPSLVQVYIDFEKVNSPE